MLGTDPFPQITAKYLACTINAGHSNELSNIAVKINANRIRYDAVALTTKMPWFLIAAIHSMEAGLNFNTYLQNGDPLFDSHGNGIKTTHVPSGVGPFNNWQDAAIEALGGLNAGASFVWSIGQCLHWSENYNGTGYRTIGLSSPYIWSYTNEYVCGKYVSDGVFSPTAVSKQPGVASIFKTLSITTS